MNADELVRVAQLLRRCADEWEVAEAEAAAQIAELKAELARAQAQGRGWKRDLDTLYRAADRAVRQGRVKPPTEPRWPATAAEAERFEAGMVDWQDPPGLPDQARD